MTMTSSFESSRDRIPPSRTNSAERLVLQRLYRTHGSLVYARCRRILRDRPSAEDAVHETFLRVRPYLANAASADDLLPLLCRIATNYCLKVLRRRSVQARLLDFNVAPESSEHQDAQLTRFQAKQALQHLPEQTRQVAVLTYAAGMTQDEVAQSLGISRRTVVYRLAELRSPTPAKRRPAAAAYQ
jgi:RNA polymerase sigma-70 factor (ECF subfamily)